MIKMNVQEAEHLSQIYNTFLKVHTQGEDTILMGRSLEALKSILLSIEVIKEEENNIGQEG